MKKKRAVKTGIDILMTLCLLFMMRYQFWDGAAHEWAGAGMFLLFIVHHVLNRGWYKSLFRGKYTAVRLFQAVTDIFLLAAMICLMVSGVTLSSHVFCFLPIHGGMSAA